MLQNSGWGPSCHNGYPLMGKYIRVHIFLGAFHRLRETDVGDREILAVKLALEEWRNWLEGAEHLFVVWTDHKNLESIQGAQRRNSRQAHWSLFFLWFNYLLTYRPGSKNIKPDGLSRLYDGSEEERPPELIIPAALILASPLCRSHSSRSLIWVVARRGGCLCLRRCGPRYFSGAILYE